MRHTPEPRCLDLLAAPPQVWKVLRSFNQTSIGRFSSDFQAQCFVWQNSVFQSQLIMYKKCAVSLHNELYTFIGGATFQLIVPWNFAIVTVAKCVPGGTHAVPSTPSN